MTDHTTHTDPTDEAAAHMSCAGLEPFGPEDVGLARLELKQPGSLGAERVPEGSWFLTSDPDGHSLSRGVVLLEMRKERSLLLPWDDPEREAVARRLEAETGVVVDLEHDGPVCWSRDRVLPVTDEGGTALAESCARCPMARWRMERGRRVQDCAESYRLLLWDEGADAACVYHARGAALQPVRNLLTNLRVDGRRFGLPACGFQLGLAARLVYSAEVPYWVPVFSRPYRHVDPRAWERFTRIREACAPRAASLPGETRVDPSTNGGRHAR